MNTKQLKNKNRVFSKQVDQLSNSLKTEITAQVEDTNTPVDQFGYLDRITTSVLDEGEQ